MHKKLLIHIGYPKTATTSLQLNLFNDLNKIGKIEYLNHLNNPSTGYLGNYYVKNVLQSIVSNNNIPENEIKNELQALNTIDKDISVISAETLSFWYPGFSYSLINSNAKQNAQKFRDIFLPYFDIIEILIGIRAQQTLLRGCYKQWYYLITGENPKFTKIDNWLNANIYSKTDTDNLGFNFNVLISEYMQTFGKANTHILVYEDLLHDKTNYLKKLSQIFNINISFVYKSLLKEKQNSSILTSNGVETENATIGQIITQPFRHIIKKRFSDSTFNTLKKLYHGIIPSSIDKKRTARKAVIRDLTQKEKDLILEKYRDSNLRLIERFDLDKNKMKKYGYI